MINLVAKIAEKLLSIKEPENFQTVPIDPDEYNRRPKTFFAGTTCHDMYNKLLNQSRSYTIPKKESEAAFQEEL